MAFGESEGLDITPYEVLVGDASAVSWIVNPWIGNLRTTDKNPPPTRMKQIQAIEGGFYKGGTTFLLAQARIEGHGWHPGKIGVYWKTCGTVLKRKVLYQTECRVLVWA